MLLYLTVARQIRGKYYTFDVFSVSVQIKYQGMESANGISWSISDTQCKSILPSELRPGTEYKKDCNLAIGQSYTLKCDSPDEGWWKSNYVVIENSVYCEYARGKRQTTVTITGKMLTSHAFFTSH